VGHEPVGAEMGKDGFGHLRSAAVSGTQE